MRLSVIIPAYNEAGNAAGLVCETFETVPPELLGEVVVVDDCSDDATGAELTALLGDYARLRYIRHASRSGQSTALKTGIWAANHPIIATMDGDGQNDPRDIAKLAGRIGAPGSGGVALVGGVRAKRRAKGSRRFASSFANWLRGAILKDNCPDTGCGIKVFWRDAFIRLPFFTSMHRYLPALFQTYGHQVDYVPVNDRPRLEGQSKYTNFGRAMVGIYDLFGVTWLRRRTKAPAIERDLTGASSGAGNDGASDRAGGGPEVRST